MSKVIYVIDTDKNENYKYNIEEDTIIYHFSVNSSSCVKINLCKNGVSLFYYYNNINYDENKFSIKVKHLSSNTHSEVFCHGVNVYDKKLDYDVEGIVLKSSSKCICNQDNRIINLVDGKSIIKPKLLIDNYDVDSNHSAYIGKFSDEEIFYMMSRGMSKDVAYRLLLRGFLINSDSIEFDKISDFIEEINKI